MAKKNGRANNKADEAGRGRKRKTVTTGAALFSTNDDEMSGVNASVEPQEKAAEGITGKESFGQLLTLVGNAVREVVVGLYHCLWERSWVISTPGAVVLTASLLTYSSLDPSFSVATTRTPENLCGLWGAWISDFLLGTFGNSAWWLVIGCLMVTFFSIRSQWLASQGETANDLINPPRFTSFFGLCALMMGSASLEAMKLRHFSGSLPGEPGGALGTTLSYAVAHYTGTPAAMAVFFVLFAIGLSLLMDFSWSDVAEGIGRFIDNHLLKRFSHDKVDGSEFADDRERAFDAVDAKATAEPISTLPVQGALTQEIQIVRPEEVAKHEPPTLFADEVLLRSNGEAGRPSLNLLDEPEVRRQGADEETIQMTSRLIVAKLKSYGIDAKVMGAQPGPVITQYWIEPGEGVKGTQIEGVRDDLRRALGVQAVRVVLTIPKKTYVGLEVPNAVREMVRLKEIIKSEAFEQSRSPLTLALGKDIAGAPMVIDLAKTPHLLVAGTTGSGKSVGINAMILSMLYRNTPEELRLVLIDPKMLEFSLYNGIPHLLTPVVTDMNKASAALKWLTAEMDRRYAVMSHLGVRQFSSYNERVADAIRRGEPIRDPMAAKDDPLAPALQPWPYIVCVVDELADLMLTNRKEVEGEITRLTQKARAAGIHLILATQRPSVDVVTSLIKANVPTRISFQVASSTDSRVILGESGAEQLLGNGDMLLHRPGVPGATRIQGCYVADGEVTRVVDALKGYGEPVYVEGVTDAPETEDEENAEGGGRRSGESDPLYDKAVKVVLHEKRPSISLVQRHLGIGYNRAANILEAMEDAGLVSKPNAVGKRTLLVPGER